MEYRKPTSKKLKEKVARTRSRLNEAAPSAKPNMLGGSPKKIGFKKILPLKGTAVGKSKHTMRKL
jgi:hypothetical protein